jgi:hypothetical protein
VELVHADEVFRLEGSESEDDTCEREEPRDERTLSDSARSSLRQSDRRPTWDADLVSVDEVDEVDHIPSVVDDISVGVIEE